MTLTLIKGDTHVSSGKYVLETDPWGRWGPPALADDQWDVSVVGGDMGDHGAAQMQWRFPLPMRAKPWAYPYIAKGVYWDAQPEVAQQPYRLDRLKQFDFASDVSMLDTESANFLPEFFATSEPGPPGTSAIRKTEVAWLLNAPKVTLDWYKGLTRIGAFFSRGNRQIGWEARITQGGSGTPYTLITSADYQPMLSGTVDALSAIQFLTAKGVLNPLHWINGFGFGFEPLGGAGGGTINRAQVALS